MGERGWGLLEFTFVTLWLLNISQNTMESKESLKSIDEKMHTHAADGSIQGIRGWY
jgi:hypothetical protein